MVTTEGLTVYHFLMVCSLPCVAAALNSASEVERKLGTLSDVGMTSQWLLLTTGSDDLLNHLDVTNITMDNVSVLQMKDRIHGDTYCRRHQCQLEANGHTLLWQQNRRRTWSSVGRVCFHHTSLRHPSHEDFTNHSAGQHADNEVYRSNLGHRLFPNVRRGFNGRRISVITMEWLSYAMSRTVAGNKEWYGVLPDLLHVLSEQLNFTYDIKEPAHLEWGAGTLEEAANGYHGYLVRKEADMGLGPSVMLPERWPAMDFSTHLVRTSYVLIYRKPAFSRTPFSFTGALHTWVYVAILGALVVVSCALWVLEIVDKPPCKDKKKEQEGSTGGVTVYTCRDTRRWKRWVGTLDNVLEVVVSALLCRPSEIVLSSPRSHMLLFSWMLLSLVVAAAYGGTLTASLTVNRQPQPFGSLQDLLSSDHSYTWGTVGNAAFLVSLQNSNDSVLRDLWRGIQRFSTEDGDVISQNLTVLTQKVRSEDFVLLDSAMVAREYFGGECDIAVVDAGLGGLLPSLTFPEGSALTGPVSDVILRLHAAGVLSHWIEKWFSLAVCHTDPQGPPVISLLHLQGVLIILPLGMGLALTVLMIEIVGRRLKNV
ncbi:probable glutamate receptor [Littorina saxatilis]|uniref:probable glutamate receptor n=1 Tax=Littorina saxatilis TaxID=31220 RepID=UPI0038B5E18E